MRAAAEHVGQTIEGFGASAPMTLDVRRFKGLLDWPAAGEVSAGFGSAIHPQFGTKVPHPGLDIEAPANSEFRSVFDGTVVYAAWMRGYGLTAIVDHGQGVMTVYAHASALVVEPGDEVERGQMLGLVGQTGSLRGPYLYFEVRIDGDAVDPLDWLRSQP
jgi:murein DD-endopeptidase MepM/ murein hydrolase activator NlpD